MITRFIRQKKMIDEKILEAYLSGKGAEKEREAVIRWFNGVIEEQELRRISLKYWYDPSEIPQIPRERASVLLDGIHHRISLHERVARKRGMGRTGVFRVLTRIAAVLFIPLVISFWLLRNQLFPEVEPVLTEIVCPPGTRTMFHLPDGSMGWLNGGSSLQYPAEFRGKTREVTLAGEGFFQVESSPGKPFLVSAGGISIRAVGTIFNVTAIREKTKTEVTLVEGAVDIIRDHAGRQIRLASLNPGQIAFYNATEQSLEVARADVEKQVSWKDGKLIFRHDSFHEVVEDLSRWYNVDMVIMDDDLRSDTYVGTFQDETLEEVLKLLSLTAPISYKDLGRQRKPDGTFEKRRIELRLKRGKNR